MSYLALKIKKLGIPNILFSLHQRHIFLLSVIALTGLGSCLDLDKETAVGISDDPYEIALPLVNTKATVGGITEASDISSNIRIDPTGKVTVLYNGEVINGSSASIFPPFPGIEPLRMTDTFTNVEIFDPARYQIRKAIFKDTKIYFRFENNQPQDVDILLTIPKLTKNGQAFTKNFKVDFKGKEEIGLRGAEMIARRIKPDVAIITDVTHDTTTPMFNKQVEAECSCGKGPSLTYGPAVHNKLLDVIQATATKSTIPLQYHAVSRSTGTDTDSFAYANDGCPSALISIPLRYMHTTVEMLHNSDIENTVKLIYPTG